MKIKLLSDLHMEGYKFRYSYSGEEVLFLAGDIHTKGRHHELIEQVPEDVQIIFTPGNHEFYGSSFEETLGGLRLLETRFKNFKVLYNQSMVLPTGTSVYGGTMFSDVQLHGLSLVRKVRRAIEGGISDFRVIKGWSLDRHEEEFYLFKKGLETFIKETKDSPFRIVMSHFMPHLRSIHPKFKKEILLNPYFCSDMSEFMGWKGMWLHGHGHDSFDYQVGETRVLSNPRGYGTENTDGFILNLILEV